MGLAPGYRKEEGLPIATAGSGDKAARSFFLLLFALSIPFWLIGFWNPSPVFAQIPVSALQAACPLLAAVILASLRAGRVGVRMLFNRVFAIRLAGFRIWYLLGFLTMPVVMLLSYAAMRMLGRPVPEPEFSLLSALAAFAVFLVGAVAEESGWIGYAADPLLKRRSALAASLILGAVWAVWHVIPYIQAGRSATWIFWQCVFTVLARMLIVWLYVGSGRQVPVAVLFYAMINVTYVLFPENGSHYDPAVTSVILAALVAAGLCLPEGKSLARLRSGGVQK